MSEKNEMNLRKIVGYVVGFAVGFAALYFIAGTIPGGRGDEKVLKELQAVSGQMNKNCPMQIDAYTVLKATSVLPPRTLRYHYALTLPDGFDLDTAKQEFIPVVKQQVRTLPDMQTLREVETVFSYYYDAPDGTHLFDFEVTPQDYR